MFHRQDLSVSLAGLMLIWSAWVCAAGPVPLNEELLKIVGGGAPEGWELYDEALQFSPDNLYQQIDGRAELFLSYNVVSLTYGTFDDSDGPSSSINFSLYDMGTPLNAFGIFSVERSPGEQMIPIARAGYRSGANHYVWKGQYYIRAVASDSAQETQEASWHIVQKVAQELIDTGEEIWGLNQFSSEGLVTDSLKFFLVDALGLDFMRNTFVATYRMDEVEISAFISKRQSMEEALHAFREYAGFGERYGSGTQTTFKNGSEFLLCKMKQDYDVVTTKGVYLIGVTAVPDRAVGLEKAFELSSRCCSGP